MLLKFVTNFPVKKFRGPFENTLHINSKKFLEHQRHFRQNKKYSSQFCCGRMVPGKSFFRPKFETCRLSSGPPKLFLGFLLFERRPDLIVGVVGSAGRMAWLFEADSEIDLLKLSRRNRGIWFREKTFDEGLDGTDREGGGGEPAAVVVVAAVVAAAADEESVGAEEAVGGKSVVAAAAVDRSSVDRLDLLGNWQFGSCAIPPQQNRGRLIGGSGLLLAGADLGGPWPGERESDEAHFVDQELEREEKRVHFTNF